MKKRVFCVFLAIVLLATAAGAISCQKVPSLTLEEKKAALIETLSDGKYDKDYVLADLMGSNLIDLTSFQRSLLVEAFFEDEDGEQQLIASAAALGWIYGEGHVVAPIQLFYLMDQTFGIIPLWQAPGIILKTYLLPDIRVDDGWQKEELGEVVVNEEMGLAVIKRTNPTIRIPEDNYVLGKYGELSVGDVIYMTSQNNGRITVKPTAVSEILTHVKSKNLFSVSANLVFREVGSLAFAIRDGKPEFLGFLSVVESVEGDSSRVYVYYADVQQVVDFIGPP